MRGVRFPGKKCLGDSAKSDSETLGRFSSSKWLKSLIGRAQVLGYLWLRRLSRDEVGQGGGRERLSESGKLRTRWGCL